MATRNEQLELIMGKAIAEPAFRQRLLDDPVKAVQEAKIELNPETLTQLKNFKREDLAAIAQDIDARISKCAGSAVAGPDATYNCYIH
jgi:hypothetical protein